jgi:LysR family transcriptional regulator, glycine cleavage system transcriptional activator
VAHLRALPPLHFLPAVEAAARLGSFRAAADELHLTPSAISQQIRGVEDALGAELFRRIGRTVALTAEGQLYCHDVRRTLLELADAGHRLKARSSGRVLRLSTVDVLAHEFLIPRLPAFQEQFPDVELRIETSMRVVELGSSEIDAALRVRGRAGPGFATEPIGSVVATPVCSSEIAARVRARKDLAGETLIEMRGSTDGSWASALGRLGTPTRNLRIIAFESYLETLTAAERGLGVAIGLFPMSTSWVLARRLVAPFPARTPVEGGVYLVFRANDPRHGLLREIAAWLREQYAELPALPGTKPRFRITPGPRRPPR